MRSPRGASALILAVSALSCSALSCSAGRPPLIREGESATPPPPPPIDVGPLQTKVALADVGLDAAALDRKAEPCTDFYQFACGGWEASAQIPGDEGSWYRSFSEIEKRNQELLRAALENAASKPAEPVERQLGAFYGACMNEAAIEQAKLEPVQPLMKKARAVSTAASVGQLLGELHKHRIWAVFDVSAGQDYKDATRRIVTLDQNGLGLPEKDSYTARDAEAVALRKTYVDVVTKVLAAGGFSEKDAAKGAEDVLLLETALAAAQKSREDRRDPETMYNKLDQAGLAKTAPEMPWAQWAKALGIGAPRDVSVTHVPYFQEIGKLLPGKTFQAPAWKAYLSWHILRSVGRSLPKSIDGELFRLTAALSGASEDSPRWKRCVEATDAAMGELLGQVFVARAFAGDSKLVAEQMAARVREAFAAGLRGLDWMDEPTKSRAKQKLDAMALLIGHPKHWKTYDFVQDKKAYARTVLAARAWETARDLSRLGRPLDREEWQMSPPSVNAYYDAQQNHMVFPAGILQPPFYSVKSHLPVNLGGIGMVIGHELTHGFDDEGARFAADGNLSKWWSPPVLEAFQKKTACVKDQYDQFEPLPGLHVKGKLTLGENIADLGGIKLAFQAYRAMRRGAAEVLVADGFSEDQQFFLAHGQAWCAKYREKSLRRLVEGNAHSPPRYRVNGPLVNTPAFAEAFQCKAGSPMAPAKTCTVW